jgi:hypothetical protein
MKEVAMIKDGQVRKLRRRLAAGDSLTLAARRSGMDEKTARKYRKAEALPSELKNPRNWRTRQDPFEDVWGEVESRLSSEPQLRAFVLFAWLQSQYPGRFTDAQRRTFERRVRAWRAACGPAQEVMFPQRHVPGDLAASDFTHMHSLRITIDRQPFDHLLYHFVLTYSNWEFVSICFSESFEAFSRGLQGALWALGGVPRRHRSDSLSAAVNNLSDDREFRARYQDLLDHYRLEPHRINVRKAHENGDVESSHGHLKTIIDQALLLRGSRDFNSREDYQNFLETVLEQRNVARTTQLEEEREVLAELPPTRVDYRTQSCGIRVSRSSTIKVKRNVYSVPSRLIGHNVDAVIDADFIEIRHGGVEVQRMPRLVGTGKHAINYRHVIDSLVRKPGAFENYQYREDMFPTSHFRIAYDALLRDHSARVAVRDYLKILQLAAHESQDAVQDALRSAINEGSKISFQDIRAAVEHHQHIPPPTDVTVDVPALSDFDFLLQYPDMEVDRNEYEIPQVVEPPQAVDGSPSGGIGDAAESDHDGTHGTLPRSSVADVPGTFCELGRQGHTGIEKSSRLPGRADGSGMPGAQGKQDCSPSAGLPSAVLEDVEQLQLEATSATGVATAGEPAGWRLSRSSGEPAVVRETRLREEPLSLCAGRTTHSPGTLSAVHYLQPACPAASDR